MDRAPAAERGLVLTDAGDGTAEAEDPAGRERRGDPNACSAVMSLTSSLSRSTSQARK
ncbi:hypothetical protein ABZX62_26310 [Streptomyces flavidovirens]|uniref:Uncharacterized protein n=1 Tax=Streptomyces flavidovirens TaxID=67298 RepID=A0ABW6RND6_9ACTN